MSWWLQRKDRTGRRSIYLLDLPWELALPLIGIVIAILVLLLRRLGF